MKTGEGGLNVDDGGRRWDRGARESEEAYAAFLAYRDMGPDRSIDAVALQILGEDQRSSKRAASGRLFRWSSEHDWVARCVAWDNYLQRARDKVAVREAVKWERRRQKELEVSWQTAQRLREKLDKMLAWPIQRQETSKDGKTIIIEPARWSFQTVALLAKTAAEIGAAVLLAVGQDVDALSEAEARAIADADPERE